MCPDHELIHTRPQEPPKSLREEQGESREERYGFEELVAELGTAFLSATCGLDNSSRLDDASAFPVGSRRSRTIKSYSCKRRAPRRRQPILSSVKLRSRRTKRGLPHQDKQGAGALAQVVRRLRDFCCPFAAWQPYRRTQPPPHPDARPPPSPSGLRRLARLRPARQ